MSKSFPWVSTVTKSQRLTANMHRIAFGGPDLAGVPEDCDSADLKMAFTALSDVGDMSASPEGPAPFRSLQQATSSTQTEIVESLRA
jgi:NADPH-dependent ferric siderophore reductase